MEGRKAALQPLVISVPDYVQDGVIPRTQLPFVLQEIENLSQKYGYRIANVFHAGDGIFIRWFFTTSLAHWSR